MGGWNELPTNDEGSQVDRVWCFSGSSEQGYVEIYGTGCDYRLKDIAVIVPGLSEIEALVKACDLQLDGAYAEEEPNPNLEKLKEIEERRLLAEDGDLDVICARGLDLLSAPPQYRDYEEGMRYLRKASDAGLVLATYNIGVMLRDGYSGEKDLVGALRYFDQAATGGYPMAKRNAGLMRINGEGCPEDLAEGYRMLFEAAKIGDYTSLLVIGRMHLRGIYFKQDPVEGAAWLLLAHKVGLIEGSIAVGRLRESYEADDVMILLEKAEARIPGLIEELDAK
jgi:TPR repeat protein